VQIGVVALVEIEGIEAARRLPAAVGLALLAPGVADPRAAGLQGIEERVALGARGAGGDDQG